MINILRRACHPPIHESRISVLSIVAWQKHGLRLRVSSFDERQSESDNDFRSSNRSIFGFSLWHFSLVPSLHLLLSLQPFLECFCFMFIIICGDCRLCEAETIAQNRTSTFRSLVSIEAKRFKRPISCWQTIFGSKFYWCVVLLFRFEISAYSI